MDPPGTQELLNGTGGPSESALLNVSNGTSNGINGRPRNTSPAQEPPWYLRKIKVKRRLIKIEAPLWVIVLFLGVVIIVIGGLVSYMILFHTKSPSPPESPCPLKCPTDWPEINSYCYYVSEEKMNWTAAQQLCRDHRASLVKMTNKTEHDFKKLNVNDDFWIGLRRDQNVWKWTDGTQYNETVAEYRSSSQLNCTYLNVKIRALGCDTPRRFVCGKPVGWGVP